MESRTPDPAFDEIIAKHRARILEEWERFTPEPKQSMSYPGWFADFWFRSGDPFERGAMWSGHGKTKEEAIKKLRESFQASMHPNPYGGKRHGE